MLADEVFDPDLLAQQEMHAVTEEPPRPRERRHDGRDEPLCLHERLLVEHHVVDLATVEPARRQAVLDRTLRERRVVLLSREALLMDGGDEATVAE
jgi:hypothetical protein